jgi:hypothetical protein
MLCAAMKPPPPSPLQALEARYRQLAGDLAQVGYILRGSVCQRRTACGSPGCQCHADPPQLHGPYWQWNTKVNGKPTTRVLTKEQLHLYREWTQNRKRAEDILQQMQETASEIARLLLESPPTVTLDHGRHPQTRRVR